VRVRRQTKGDSSLPITNITDEDVLFLRFCALLEKSSTLASLVMILSMDPVEMMLFQWKFSPSIKLDQEVLPSR
jgi:hypothetical protein